MALITCPECGQQVSEKAASCPNCGCPIALSSDLTNVVNAAVQTPSIPTRKKSKKSIIVCLIALVFILSFGAWLYISQFSPEAKLNKAFSEAVLLYNNGQYAKALPCFEALGDFSNSADYIKWCKYEIAQVHLANNDWEGAMAYLSDIDYKDSGDLILNCRYKQGISAMEDFDWKTAISFFTDLNYEDSNKMLTDCSFMVALEESVLRRMEANTTEASDSRSLVTTELAYLEDFRNATFYDSTIKAQAAKYINGLDAQLAGLSYEFFYEYQHDWNTGLVARYEALNTLYLDYHFLADNKDFIGHYINQLEYHQKWLTAFNELEENGYAEEDWVFNWNNLELHFKNDTPYTSSRVFDFEFFADEAMTKLLGTTTAIVNDIGPSAEFTVRTYYPTAVQNAYYSSGIWVAWQSYYQEIKIE